MNLRAGSWLLILAMLCVGFPWVYFVARMWYFRRSFTLAARSPTLVCVAMAYGFVMMMALFCHWIMINEHHHAINNVWGLPCAATFWLSYAFYPFFMIPYMLRAVRLVVVYDPVFRREYSRFVKWNTLMKVWAVTTVIILGFATFVYYDIPERYQSNKFGCFFWEEDVVFLPALVATTIPTVILTYLMLQVDDAFKIGRELVMVVAIGVSISIAEFVLQGLIRKGVIPHSVPIHAMEEFLVLSKIVNSFVWSMLLPMSQFDGWRWCGPFHRVELGTEGSFRPVEDIWEAELTGVSGVLSLVRRFSNGEIVQLFESYCRKHLCLESWEFILEAVRYERLTLMDEQYSAFLRILDRYIKSTSPQEVNISGSLRDRMCALEARTVFVLLSPNNRRTILGEALSAISKLLDQNLFGKFTHSEEIKSQFHLKMRERYRLEGVRVGAEGDRSLQHMIEIAQVGSVGGRTQSLAL